MKGVSFHLVLPCSQFLFPKDQVSLGVFGGKEGGWGEVSFWGKGVVDGIGRRRTRDFF